MYGDLVLLLRQVLLDRVDELIAAEQVGFAPPDDEWRKAFRNVTVNAESVNSVNIYVVDLRENRRLRGGPPSTDVSGGVVRTIPPALRVDCHLLVTAWSPATRTPGIEPTQDELDLLGKVTQALLDAQPIVPADYPGAGLSPGFLAEHGDDQLPLLLLPPEGFPKYAEFWGTMGTTVRPWKPAVYVVATVPVSERPVESGIPVTTRIARYRSGSEPLEDVRMQIGGVVRRPSGDPAPGAWVVLERPPGTIVASSAVDRLGRFMFLDVAATDHRLRAGGVGSAPTVRDVTVPSPTGEYDLTLP